MKIHSLQNPPAGLTWMDVTVETVEVVNRGTAKLRIRIGAAHGVINVEYESLAELPAPDDAVRVSLWTVP